jgi:hypothetical protein
MNARRDSLLIVGAGTLGSALLELVVRTALPRTRPLAATVVVCDPDQISLHNVPKSALYRPLDVGQFKAAACQDWARQIDPDLVVHALCAPVQEIGLGLFLEARAVLICADTYRGKLEASRAAWRAGAPLIMSGELASSDPFGGRYRWFCPGPDVPCIECGWNEEYRYLEARFPCSQAGAAPGPATRLSDAYRIASLMLDETQRILEHGPGAEHAAEVRLYPEARRFTVLRPRFNPNCLFDHRRLCTEALVPLPEPAATLTLGDAFTAACRHLPGASRLLLGTEIGSAFSCPCGHAWSALRSLSQPSPLCPRCADPRGSFPTALTWQVGRGMLEQHADTLLSLLVPPGDVLTFAGVDSAAETITLAVPSA